MTFETSMQFLTAASLQVRGKSHQILRRLSHFVLTALQMIDLKRLQKGMRWTF